MCECSSEKSVTADIFRMVMLNTLMIDYATRYPSPPLSPLSPIRTMIPWLRKHRSIISFTKYFFFCVILKNMEQEQTAREDYEKNWITVAPDCDDSLIVMEIVFL